MHDIRRLRDTPAAFDAALGRRGDAPVSSALLALDAARRAKILAAETAQAAQNQASKQVGAAKARGDEDEFQRLRALVSEKKAEVAALQDAAKALDAQLTDALAHIPNLPADDVPDGADEDDNVEQHRFGSPRSFDFAPVEHYQIGSVTAAMDFETAAKVSGSRFVMLRGAVARIHRAMCSPRLVPKSAKLLEDQYVRYRQEMRERAKKGGAPAVPITVRQLEAITRVSESLAKMCLQSKVSEEHVQEALRLFEVSTIDAARSGAARTQVAVEQSGVARTRIAAARSGASRARGAVFFALRRGLRRGRDPVAAIKCGPNRCRCVSRRRASRRRAGQPPPRFCACALM